MQHEGYYRFPTIHGDNIVFVSENDLWVVPLSGGIARRLTQVKASLSFPVFAPDGTKIAFCAHEEGGSEVYTVPLNGGEISRLTYLAQAQQVCGWYGDRIYFAGGALQAFDRVNTLFALDPETGSFEDLHTGPANFMSRYGSGAVIQRHGLRDYSAWKRYRGGTAGQLWIDPKGKGNYTKLIDLKGNLTRPLWIQHRIYFTSDHEGVGNIYSCNMQGADIKRHTHHDVYYARNIATDGKTIVYHAGGDIYAFDIAREESYKVEITYPTTLPHQQRKFVSSHQYLEDYALSPQGSHLAIVSRGQPFSFENWQGPVYGKPEAMSDRCRHVSWLNDGHRLVATLDGRETDALMVYDVHTLESQLVTIKSDIGRILDLQVLPNRKDEIIACNHRSELLHIKLKSGKAICLDRSSYGEIQGFDCAPDGQWVCYGFHISRKCVVIKLYDLKNGKSYEITKPVLRDVEPVFDPEGNYIYFLSHREFNPVIDQLHFDYGFPRGMRPYLITLREDLPSPFEQWPEHLLENCSLAKEKDEKARVKRLQIDLEGIQERLLSLPVDDGIYSQIAAIPGKVFFLHHNVEGRLDEDNGANEASLEYYDMAANKLESYIDNVHDYGLSKDLTTLVYRTEGNKLRVLRAGERPENSGDEGIYTKKKGWINLKRVKVLVYPNQEWRQMFDEAWRLQRDYYWTPDMADVNWQEVYDHYVCLIPRVGTREELNDLLWEMQGELGTSHCYAFGGDVKRPPAYYTGTIGAQFMYEPKYKAYRMYNIAHGDVWNPQESSPLKRTGVHVQEGDLLWAINGHPLSQELRPEVLLLNRAREVISLRVSGPKGKNVREVMVQCQPSDLRARYRDWVERNRAYVHKKTNGQVGYIHIPDMGAEGYSEFHRSFLLECDRPGLIVDVRYNGGGHVSALLLEKLARRRLGYDQTRWFGRISYPEDAPMGPMVALTNEYAGSDGDMFSHAFKRMKLGPLIGTRTWGGVIGIWVRHHLIDGGFTSQPEFSFWFEDAGWSIENYGAEPDIEVDFLPQDYRDNRDPQLDRSIEEVEKIIHAAPIPELPELTTRPSLRRPKLPKH